MNLHRYLRGILFGTLAIVIAACFVNAFPTPSPYPISWELKFEHSGLKRVTITPAASKEQQTFWYITFTVTNVSKEEQRFLPVFEMLTEDDQILRSDDHVPAGVLETIRIRERKPSLESLSEIAGTLRVGEDQARDGVAIWAEPKANMSRLSVFAKGLSGEAVILKDAKGNPVERKAADGKKEPVILWKTLQLDYHMPGGDKNPGRNSPELVERHWVMR